MTETRISNLTRDQVLSRLDARAASWRESERPVYLSGLGLGNPRVRRAGNEFRIWLGPAPRGRLRFEARGRVDAEGSGSRITAEIRPTLWTYVEFGVVVIGLGYFAFSLESVFLGVMGALMLLLFGAVSVLISRPYADALRLLLSDIAGWPVTDGTSPLPGA